MRKLKKRSKGFGEGFPVGQAPELNLESKQKVDRQKQTNTKQTSTGNSPPSFIIPRLKKRGTPLTIITISTSTFRREAGHLVGKEVEGTSQMVMPKLSLEG